MSKISWILIVPSEKHQLPVAASFTVARIVQHGFGLFIVAPFKKFGDMFHAYIFGHMKIPDRVEQLMVSVDFQNCVFHVD